MLRAGRQVRPTRDVSGVVKVGSDADCLYYNVELHTVTGSVRVCVCLARTLLNVQRLRKWSVGELALLQFLQMGVPPEFGLPRTVLWRECVHLLGADAIVAKLHELTGYMHDARDVARGMQELGEQAQAMQGGSARSGCMKRSCLLPGSIVRVLPGEVSALEYQTSREGGAVADDMETGSSSAAADFNHRLISTSVKRAAIAKSDSAWRRGETEITTNIGADGKRTKARVGGHVLSSIDKKELVMLRHATVRTVFKLPPMLSISGTTSGASQLFVR